MIHNKKIATLLLILITILGCEVTTKTNTTETDSNIGSVDSITTEIPEDIVTAENRNTRETYDAATKTLGIKEGVTDIESNLYESRFIVGTVEKLTLPSTLRTIGDNAFSGVLRDVTEITIPDSVTTIGDRAFYGTLEKVSLTEKLYNSLGSDFHLKFSFQNPKLGNEPHIYEPHTIEIRKADGTTEEISIYTAASIDSDDVSAFFIDDQDPTRVSLTTTLDGSEMDQPILNEKGEPIEVSHIISDGFILDLDQPDQTSVTEVSDWGNSLIYIGETAFQNQVIVTMPEFPDSLKIIYDRAFKNAFASTTKISTLTIPQNVTYIGEAAFEITDTKKATTITTIIFNKDISKDITIKKDAFKILTLTTVQLPKALYDELGARRAEIFESALPTGNTITYKSTDGTTTY